MDIDFIKWMCEKAECFKGSDKNIWNGEEDIKVTFPDGKWHCFPPTTNTERFVYYPLLLQRAIEGVNREWCKNTTSKAYSIEQQPDMVILAYDIAPLKLYSISEMTRDQAKESALKYIYGNRRRENEIPNSDSIYSGTEFSFTDTHCSRSDSSMNNGCANCGRKNTGYCPQCCHSYLSANSTTQHNDCWVGEQSK